MVLQKMSEYFNRAEYIKKNVITPKQNAINNPQPQGGGGAGTLDKNQEESKEDKEKEKL